MDLKSVLPNRLYQVGEVAGVFRVNPKTVVRWIKAGQFRYDEYLRTAGGHHRVYGSGIIRLARRNQAEEGSPDGPPEG